MSLADIQTFTLYDVKIPSTGKKAKFRPFVVDESRALLTAQESEDVSVMLNTLVSVVKACIQPTPKELTTFDVEYLFVQIRMKSVGEQSTLLFTCNKCKEKTTMNIELDKVEVYTPPEHSKKIILSDNLAIVMSYPSVEQLADLDPNMPKDQAKSRLIASIIDSVYQGDAVVKMKDEKPEDVLDFVNRKLTPDQFKKLEDFLTTTPETRLTLDWTCPHCNAPHKSLLRGINSFF